MDESFSISRLEAFSDGVFAIAITLLILEVGVPAGTRDVGAALLHIWPSYLAYVTSFLTIGVIWVNHHSVFTLLARADRTLVFLNTLMLLVVAFIPFPTRLVADFLREPHGEREAALALGITFVLLAVVFQVWWRWISTGRRLLKDTVPEATVEAITRSYNPALAIYAGASVLALASPLACIAILLALAIYFALPPSLVTRRR